MRNNRLALPLAALFVLCLNATPTVASAGSPGSSEKEFKARLIAECEKNGGDPGIATQDNAKKTQRSYQCIRDGRIDGKHTGVYLPGLERESSGQICDGKICGRWDRWDRTGAPIDSGEWKDGIPDGDWVIYRRGPGVPPGTRKEYGTLVQGKKTCGWTILDATGNVDEAGSLAFCPRSTADRKSLRWGLGLGVSVFANEERGQFFNMTALVPKAGARYRLSDAFSLGASAFLSTIPLARTDSSITVNYLGANLRLDYRVPFRLGPLILGLAGGLSYGRMFVSGGDFGYGNLLYPQIFPSASWPASFGTVSGYVKYVPMNGGLFTTDNRELAFGLSFEPRSSLLPPNLAFSLDMSDLQLRPGNRFRLSSTAVTFGVGLIL
jgi:hypothetical protein